MDKHLDEVDIMLDELELLEEAVEEVLRPSVLPMLLPVIDDPVLPASGTGTQRGGTFTQPTPTVSPEAAEAEIMVVAGGTGIIPGGVPSIEV